MMRRVLKLFSCLAFSLTALGFASFHRSPIMAAELEHAPKVGAPSQSVAVALYGQLRTKPGNVFFSPFSIAEALAMTDVGARGQTAAQLKALLAADPAAYGAWARQVSGKHTDYELHTGNALWLQQGEPFKAEFLATLTDAFDAKPHTADFRTAAAAAVGEINGWIAEQTNQKITGLLGPRSLNQSTRLVIANAVYFKGTWQHTFAKHSTSDRPFHTADGKEMSVPTMWQSASFGYGEDAAVQVLEMPYRGNELSMLVVLPRKADGLADVEKDLTAEKLGAWMQAVQAQHVDVELPKFTMRQMLELVPVLKAIGVTDLFTPGQADLSGIDGTHDLYASNVAHGAFVRVDEEGTEAAAATVVRIAPSAVARVDKVQQFHADHPFLFVIRHNPTGGILFMGRVEKPEALEAH